MTQQKLNELLRCQIDDLKSLATASDTPIKFILDGISFEEEELDKPATGQERIITGRIFPTSDPFKEGAFRIEIRLLAAHPFVPPKVRFLTPIYHPNVGKDGEFTHQLLQQTARWSNSTSIVEIITAVVNRIDEPDMTYSLDSEAAREYMTDRERYYHKALELVKSQALPRN